MIKLKTYHYTDNQVFGCEAFSILIPEGWSFSGGLVWRWHPTMPGAFNFSVRSSSGTEELRILPSMPYCWNSNPMSMFTFPEGSNYMGNEVRRPVSGYLQYIKDYILRGYGAGARIAKADNSPGLADSLRAENQGGFGTSVHVDAGTARLEYQRDGIEYEEDISCGVVFVNMMYGFMTWTADKVVTTRAPRGKLDDNTRLFMTMLKSLKLDLNWYNLYCQYVQSLVQYGVQDIYNAGLISRIVSNTYNSISDMVRSSYERQQAAYSRVYAGISESIRGVNSYYDPYKGYGVELPGGYRYAYGNSLGEYIFTDNPNFNPNIGSNINWSPLNRT